MNFKEQTVKLPIENFDALVEHDKRAKRHGDLLPDSIRAVFSVCQTAGKQIVYLLS